MRPLKAELHAHAKGDPAHALSYTVKDLIDAAHKHHYQVLAVTFHDKVFEGPKFRRMQAYAKKKNILLIPGCEATIEKRHTLIYNITERERKRIKTFRDLRRLRKEKMQRGEEMLVIAPHPFFSTPLIARHCLGRKLIGNIDIFDAIEYSFFYLKRYNKNKRAMRIAKRYLKPVVGNADIHVLENLNFTYTMINSEKTVEGVIRAIKQGDITLVTKPLKVRHLAKLAYFYSYKS